MKDEIDVNKINSDFSKQGNACFFLSYCYIINYYSENSLEPIDIYRKFLSLFHGNKFNFSSQLEMEQNIYDTYYEQCKDDKRGFSFICEIHNDDKLDTSKYCKVKDIAAQANVHIHENIRLNLRDRLKTEGGLAMILFPLAVNHHAVVVGFDNISNKYFYRNPTFSGNEGLVYVDILKNTPIYEYIWFSRF